MSSGIVWSMVNLLAVGGGSSSVLGALGKREDQGVLQLDICSTQPLHGVRGHLACLWVCLENSIRTSSKVLLKL